MNKSVIMIVLRQFIGQLATCKTMDDLDKFYHDYSTRTKHVDDKIMNDHDLLETKNCLLNDYNAKCDVIYSSHWVY